MIAAESNRHPSAGFEVSCHAGPPPTMERGAIEIDVGSATPVAFAGVRRVLRDLEARLPDVVQAARASGAAEWNALFPGSPVRGLDLLLIADAPNQRRLFRESEQTFRTLGFFARVLVAAARERRRPVVLRNVGSCDLVSLRGIMHAVELSRLSGSGERLMLCDLDAVSFTTGAVASLRAEQFSRAFGRMRARGDLHVSSGHLAACAAPLDPSLEGRYLAVALDTRAPAADRVAASLLALRACFFSTSYEGAILAAESGLRTLDASGELAAGALLAAWDRLDDAALDIPMIELDRESIVDVGHVRAQLELNLGVTRMFVGHVEEGLAAWDRALACTIAPELRADLHMYRALTLAKRLGKIAESRVEIEAGLGVLRDGDPMRTRVSEAWLRNLYALTYVFEKDLPNADRQERLALAAIDEMPGASAAHLKTNLVSNFSVLYEAKGDLGMALSIWQSFEVLNRKLESVNANKVQAHRLAALQHANGSVDDALGSYERSFRCADTTDDRFHGEMIAATLGRIHLSRGARDDAEHWYAAAAERALACGDAVQRARDLAGLELARGGADFAGARSALACNSTYTLARPGLAEARATGDPDAVRTALPAAKTKMSRPFDLVNL